jgi:hypothetical protein
MGFDTVTTLCFPYTPLQTYYLPCQPWRPVFLFFWIWRRTLVALDISLSFSKNRGQNKIKLKRRAQQRATVPPKTRTFVSAGWTERRADNSQVDIILIGNFFVSSLCCPANSAALHETCPPTRRGHSVFSQTPCVPSPTHSLRPQRQLSPIPINTFKTLHYSFTTPSLPNLPTVHSVHALWWKVNRIKENESFRWSYYIYLCEHFSFCL